MEKDLTLIPDQKNSSFLKESQMLHNFFMQAPAILAIMKGPDHVFEFANPAFIEFIGNRSPIGKTVRDFVPELEGQVFFELLDNVYNTGETFIGNEMPVTINRGNGLQVQVYLNFSYQAFKNEAGKTEGILAFAYNVTEQVTARKKIEEKEEQLRNAAEAGELGTYDFYPQTGELHWSAKNKAFFGLLPEAEVNYQIFLKGLHPDDKDRVNTVTQKALNPKNGGQYENEYRTIGYSDAKLRWVRSKGRVSFDGDGKPIRLSGVTQEITGKKEAEETLAYRTALLEAQNEAIPDAILIVDTKGKMLSFNKHFVTLWKIPEDIVERKDDAAALQYAMTQLIDPQAFIDRVNYCYAHPQEKAKEEVLFKDGRIIERYGNAVIGQDGTLYGWAWYFRDITKQKQNEQDLKNAKNQLEITFNNIPSGIYLINKNAELTYVNDNGAKVYGDFTTEELLAEKDLSVLFKKAEDFFERYDEYGKPFRPQNSPAAITLTTGLPSQTTLRQVNKKTGEERWHYVQGAPLFDDEGALSMVLVTSTDITTQKLAEEKIRQSEERFRSLANSIPQLAWMTDATGWIYWYNQRWYDYTGTTLEEMQGWGWQSVHHPDLIENVTKKFKKAIADGEPYEQIFLLRSKEGEYRWFLTRALPIRNENGEVVQWFGTNTDVTDQRNIENALKQSEEKFRTLAETMPQLVWMTDNKGAYEYASHQWMEYSGLDPKKEESWQKLVHPDDMQPMMKVWFKSLSSGEPYYAEVRLINTKGEYRWHVVQGKPIRNEDTAITKWIGAFTDIHDQKIKEQQKDEFIGIASHEMKTPLTTAKAYLQLLELSLDKDNEEANLYAKKASHAVGRLQELITELLDVSKIQHGKLNYNITSFNFNDLIDDTVQDIQQVSPKHTIIKSGKAQQQVAGDKHRLQQVIINLLNNAIKYSPDSLAVFINVQQQNGEIKVSVKDNGIGIPKHTLDKIFDKYYRVENHAIQFQGLGIGLFISYEIIQRHQGRLWAESEPGKGSVFYFTLPVTTINNPTKI